MPALWEMINFLERLITFQFEKRLIELLRIKLNWINLVLGNRVCGWLWEIRMWQSFSGVWEISLRITRRYQIDQDFWKIKERFEAFNEVIGRDCVQIKTDCPIRQQKPWRLGSVDQENWKFVSISCHLLFWENYVSIVQVNSRRERTNDSTSLGGLVVGAGGRCKRISASNGQNSCRTNLNLTKWNQDLLDRNSPVLLKTIRSVHTISASKC